MKYVQTFTTPEIAGKNFIAKGCNILFRDISIVDLPEATADIVDEAKKSVAEDGHDCIVNLVCDIKPYSQHFPNGEIADFCIIQLSYTYGDLIS